MTGNIMSLTDISEEEWDRFVECSSEAWLFHRFAFQTAYAMWGGEPLSFGVRSDKTPRGLVAIVPLFFSRLRIGSRLFSAGFLDSIGGPTIADWISEAEREKVRLQIKRHVEAVMAPRVGAVEVRYSVFGIRPDGSWIVGGNPLRFFGKDATCSACQIVDLRQPSEAIWSGMKGRARTAIRKAERCGYRVREAASEEDVLACYRLHHATYLRTGAVPHPLGYFNSIWRDFASRGMAIPLLAEDERGIVAVANIATYKRLGWYWTGASSADALRDGVNDLLQWRAMVRARERDCTAYHVGEVFANGNETTKQAGLSQFKRSFGGDTVPYFRTRTSLRPMTAYAVDIARFLKTRMTTFCWKQLQVKKQR